MKLWLAVVVVAVVLVVPVLAWAECAWVLWLQVLGGPEVNAAAASAHSTRDDCEQERKRRETMRRTPDPPGLSGVFICLPDTVDPRGPKGGR